MEVTRHNFSDALPLVRDALRDCAFFAFDCEFSGLRGAPERAAWLQDIDERYESVAASARSFAVLQFGLAAFAWEAGAYRARTFNFHLFPRPAGGYDSRFFCQASSIQFLVDHGFDFNKCFGAGVPFKSAAQRNALLAGAAGPPRPRAEIALSNPADAAFVGELVAAVAAWLQGPEPTLTLPAVNSFQRALQYQALEKPQFGAPAPPGFYVQRVDDGTGRTALQLVRATPAEVAAFKAADLEARVQAAHEAAGFAAVMDAMRDSARPVVAHNALLDLAHCLHAFAAPLPPNWLSFRCLATHWFPGGLYDTKYLAQQLPGGASLDTSLGALFAQLRSVPQVQTPVGRCLHPLWDAAYSAAACCPSVVHAEGFPLYAGGDAAAHAHEAGYDAFMTGAVFVRLLYLHGAARTQRGCAAGPSAAPLSMLPCPSPLSGTSGPRPVETTRDAEREAGPAPSRTAAADGAACGEGTRSALAHLAASILDQESVVSRRASGETSCGGPLTQGVATAAGGVGAVAVGGDVCKSSKQHIAAGRLESWDSQRPAEANELSLSAVEEYAGRIALGNSDLPYASISGPDPAPDRSHVLFASGLRPGSQTSELCAALAPLRLGGLRITPAQRGTQAIIVLQDRNLTRDPDELARQLQQALGAQILTYAEFARLKRLGALAWCAAGGWAFREGGTGGTRPGWPLAPTQRQTGDAPASLGADQLHRVSQPATSVPPTSVGPAANGPRSKRPRNDDLTDDRDKRANKRQSHGSRSRCAVM